MGHVVEGTWTGWTADYGQSVTVREITNSDDKGEPDVVELGLDVGDMDLTVALHADGLHQLILALQRVERSRNRGG